MTSKPGIRLQGTKYKINDITIINTNISNAMDDTNLPKIRFSLSQLTISFIIFDIFEIIFDFEIRRF